MAAYREQRLRRVNVIEPIANELHPALQSRSWHISRLGARALPGCDVAPAGRFPMCSRRRIQAGDNRPRRLTRPSHRRAAHRCRWRRRSRQRHTWHRPADSPRRMCCRREPAPQHNRERRGRRRHCNSRRGGRGRTLRGSRGRRGRQRGGGDGRGGRSLTKPIF